MRTTIHIPIYHTCIKVHIVENIGKCCATIYDKHDYLKPDIGDAHGLSFKFENDVHYLIVKRSELRHGLIAHEDTHCVDAIKKHHGLSGNEDVARLAEFIIDSIYNWLQSKAIIAPLV